MTNRNLETRPDLGPEWMRHTILETPCFDTRDATYWLWVEDREISMSGAAVDETIIEAPDWPGLRAEAFEWLIINHADLEQWIGNRTLSSVTTGDLLNEVVATHSGVPTKAAAAAKLKECDVMFSVCNPSFQVTERVSATDRGEAMDKARALVNDNHPDANEVLIDKVSEVPTPVTEPTPISREKRLEVALRAFVDAANPARFIESHILATLIKSAEETLRGAP